ncbi:exo-beta-N-acetylmuramidase NamZ family protein [Paenibacillus apiarius]|uniref:DUF1343 domain-containing protein n=1 Tax=Paenibacillus apiarius TaxID=46240 RepID=A0ABT4DLU1_9BACL|nr:DUF1343 domain-containing protein [Paenibacillus apiarius]MCY9517729.1 DUF1343 domain-containing protein [Paenibacillus apiarius]MCY9518329.1 DUF1343 domain-containing protein [Paenibacillus apiarius]MCY9551270.1 DUF1343 domain-containing protein [Paenibacillus apiarius]MCY9558424.1 DUF1343 domain-containing protein [Paenibacillus apiarius]MCY9687075.1 DUF1343 domain-containing protein [Paenibacillus apiarius]
MKLGVEVFLEKHANDYRGQRIGLVTNLTGVNHMLIPTIDLFHEHEHLGLTALFGPEHGIRGDAKEGEHVGSSVDKETGLPVYSLYGETRKPTPDMLQDVDVMVFDLQDIGTRYYTYIYTMAYVMEACGEQGIPFVVLDRPNPINGMTLEGNLVDEDCRSFVGLYPIPVRHGLTIGELAQLFKEQFGVRCDLTVIPMEGWSRKMHFDETGLLWVPPSPNASGLDMGLLYPGTCLVEGTNLSEGRGTAKPFEMVGAPFIDGYRLAKALNERRMPGILARPVSFVPTYQKHVGERCEGVQLHVTDRTALQSFSAGLQLLETITEMYPESFSYKEADFFDQLAGTKQLKPHIENGTTSSYVEQCQPVLSAFRKIACSYLLY